MLAWGAERGHLPSRETFGEGAAPEGHAISDDTAALPVLILLFGRSTGLATTMEIECNPVIRELAIRTETSY